MSSPLSYPVELDAQAIEEVLPHRGEILCVRRLTVLDFNHYIGHVIWARDLPILQGHFPGGLAGALFRTDSLQCGKKST